MPEIVAEREARIGRDIRQLRLEAGYDQLQLATRANMSRSAVQALEAGSGSRLRTVFSVLLVLDRIDALDGLMPSAGPTGPTSRTSPDRVTSHLGAT